MFIDHSSIESAKATTRGRLGVASVSCALALFLVASCGGDSGGDAVCGDNVCDSSETASSCAEDCGCGNGVVNPGEACDGSELGSATCQSETGRGGTLACNSDCTFDTSGCNLAGCGNGVAEAGEVCDGTDLGGGSCTSVGYSGGDIACSSDCTYDVSSCCNDSCLSDGATMCVGDNLRVCTLQASGCLAWEVTNCAATNEVCDNSGGTAMCACIDRCSAAGETRCEGATIETCALRGDGCLDWSQTTDCGTNGQICADAPSGPTCVADASAEDCSDPYPLSAGENVVAWTATNADYLTSQPSCNTYTLDGPDLVLSYTAPDDGFVTFTMNKPTSTRQVIVVSSAACGTIAPEELCLSDYSPATLGGEFGVTAGTTYYFYIRDTTSGSNPLDNPLIVTLDETLCSAISLTVSNLSPANGTSITNLTPILSADLDYPVDPTTGVITVIGDKGTNLSYDLSTAPSQISLTNGGKTLIIDPGMAFPADETVTVSWSGLQDSTCGTTIAPPTWSFQVTGPPCTPGTGGMVGTTVTRISTPLSSFSEYYVAADTDASGYVYVGGTSNLYRTPKAGGTTEDVKLSGSLVDSNLGYGMLVVGNDIYTLESSTTGTTGHLWRISADGGTSWNAQDYATFPMAPGNDLRGITHYKGRIYMTTDEFSATEIWSVPAGATTLPVNAVLEATISSEYYCDGIAVDDGYFYLACSTSDRMLRVDRTSLVPELLTDQFYISSTKDAVHAHDIDGDGNADALYFSSYYEEVYYVCDPSGTGPFWADVLASFGSSSSNYGLDFDPVNNTLWMFDDDTREFISIQ